VKRTFPKNSKIAVGLSGGVDSSVSAFLLKEQGFDVVGVHMQCWDYDSKGCNGKQDRADAVATASLLDIPFVSLDFQKEYSDLVMEYFYREYRLGRTPNPDILCNKEIKFGLFLDWTLQNGFDFVATGHYAKVEFDEELKLYTLNQPKDLSKDQTYFLYALNQKQLGKTIFPLADLDKKDVRKIAQEQHLPAAIKPDSVGICFVGDVDIRDFLKQQDGFNEELGDVLNTEGKIIGQHNGAVFFTIGQRHGFTITKYTGVPLYVLSKDTEKNEIVVGTYEECMRDSFDLEGVSWLGNEISSQFKCEVRVRHLGQLYHGTVDPGSKVVKLDSKAFGIAPGQSAVFYKNGVVLGGGVISH
jgi:tRNA-specific 2-thiouridylase